MALNQLFRQKPTGNAVLMLISFVAAATFVRRLDASQAFSVCSPRKPTLTKPRRTIASMASSRGDGYGGEGVTINAKEGASTATLVWLHGLGDTADGWADAMPPIAAQGCEHFKFILPTASAMQVRIGGPYPIPSWFDLFGLSPADPEDKEGIVKSVDRVMKIVQGEVAAGIPPERIAVGGFSQGGAVTLTTMMRSDMQLGAFVATSTWLPLSKVYPEEQSTANRKAPLLMCHGDADQKVTLDWAKQSAEVLESKLLEPGTLDMKIYPMGHSACMEELSDVASFLRKNIPPL